MVCGVRKSNLSKWRLFLIVYVLKIGWSRWTQSSSIVRSLLSKHQSMDLISKYDSSTIRCWCCFNRWQNLYIRCVWMFLRLAHLFFHFMYKKLAYWFHHFQVVSMVAFVYEAVKCMMSNKISGLSFRKCKVPDLDWSVWCTKIKSTSSV